MSAEATITAEQLIEWAVVRIQRNFAEALAIYANFRASGLRPLDARREVGISLTTGSKYEHWMQSYRRDHNLPALPTGDAIDTPPPPGELREIAKRSAHQRWHVRRGVTNPECEHCRTGDLCAINGEVTR